MGINVLSLFDGMSCGQIALEKVGISVKNYFASEIDKYAIAVTQKNYPNTIQLGDVTKVKACDLPKIDLLIGGSPCQGFSFAGKGLNFDDPRSRLFFEFVRLVEELKPRFFMLENVVMKQEYQNVISEKLNVKAPLRINSKYFTPCLRDRLYWVNFKVKRYGKDRHHLYECLHGNTKHLRDITDRYFAKKPGTLAFSKSREKTISISDNHYCMTTGGQGISNSGATNIEIKGRIYQIRPELGEILHGVPVGYTSGVSDTQRMKMLGNGWDVHVISHIFNSLKLWLPLENNS